MGKVGGEIENSRGGPGSGSAGCMIYPPRDVGIPSHHGTRMGVELASGD